MDNNLFIGYDFVGKYESINIGRLPGRKGYCLYHEVSGKPIENPTEDDIKYNLTINYFRPLAYFKKEEDAVTAIRLLKQLSNAVRLPDA